MRHELGYVPVKSVTTEQAQSVTHDPLYIRAYYVDFDVILSSSRSTAGLECLLALTKFLTD